MQNAVFRAKHHIKVPPIPVAEHDFARYVHKGHAFPIGGPGFVRDPLVRVLHIVRPLHAVPHIEHPRALQRVASGLVYVEQQVAIRGTDLRVAQALVGFEHDLRFLLARIEDHQRINLVFQLHRAGHAAVIRDGEMPLQRRPRREAT